MYDGHWDSLAARLALSNLLNIYWLCQLELNFYVDSFIYTEGISNISQWWGIYAAALITVATGQLLISLPGHDFCQSMDF